MMRTKNENYFIEKPQLGKLGNTGLSEALYRLGWLVARDNNPERRKPAEAAGVMLDYSGEYRGKARKP